MKKLCKGIVALVLLGWIAPVAIADDLVPPPWVRGSDRTTAQQWTFDSPTDIFGHPIQTPSGTFGNPYGNPRVINPGDFVWLPDDSTFNPNNPNPRNGVVRLVPGSTLKFFIPNQEDRLFEKNVWAQVTWWAAPGTNVVVSPLATAPNTGSIVGTLDLGAGWHHTTASFVLAEQPAFEEFWVQNFTNDNMYLDQVVIDTKCVPEPESLAALGFGLLGSLARRRKKAKLS